jgi:hypothetical protein
MAGDAYFEAMPWKQLDVPPSVARVAKIFARASSTH